MRPSAAAQTQSELAVGPYAALREAGIEIPLPRRDVRLRQDHRVSGRGVHVVRIVSSAPEQALYPRVDRGKDDGDVLVRRRRQRREAQPLPIRPW